MTTAARPLSGDPELTEDLVRSHGLNDLEYERILAMLGRPPTFTELGIFSALWSEHCAYKHSRTILKTFPTSGARVVQGPGENAGALRVGMGWAVVFKIESHNHPTAVEPYQGAATGVGGILRDVFTMGARPVALLNSLRFGPLSEPRNRYLLAGAVRGIGDYGNCVGIPTIGGEVRFAPSYSGNPLINAMCVGLAREDDLMRAVASGVGNELIAVGARTGRDGIHGASFASEDLSAESEARRPQVQVGDPFTEKLLLEASLDLIRSGHIVGIQDMGAAGLTSSSAEMAARGGVGVEIDTSLVPTREPGMTPYELLLSESQERMLVVGRKGHLEDIREITAKWELEATRIGTVTDDGMFRVLHHHQIVAEIPAGRLIDECPVYEPAAVEGPERQAQRQAIPTTPELDPTEALRRLITVPTIASKRWVFEQYDSTVRAHTCAGPGGDAGVIAVPDTAIGIAVATDGNSRYVALDPYEGGKAAVAEAACNVAVSGARPIGITNCLNFGNPERPEIFYQFREACRGIAEACRVLETPVTGGNVSFYNESPSGAIDPTPVIGMVGVIDDVADCVEPFFRNPGDDVLVVGDTGGHMGGTAYWAELLGTTGGSPPPVHLGRVQALIQFLVAAAHEGLVASAHDVSDGGLAVAIAEACIGPPYAPSALGVAVDLRALQRSSDTATLFGEDHARAVLSAEPGRGAAIIRLAAEHGLPAWVVGTVGWPGDVIDLRTENAQITLDSNETRSAFMNAIPERMQRPVSQ